MKLHKHLHFMNQSFGRTSDCFYSADIYCVCGGRSGRGDGGRDGTGHSVLDFPVQTCCLLTV